MATATTRRPNGPVLSAAHYRSASPTRVKLAGGNVRSVSLSSSSSSSSSGGVRGRRSCMCSPTNHPGSFRCSLHKERRAPGGHVHARKPTTSPPSPGSTSSSSSSSRSTPTTAEGGECARRALVAQHRRRVGGFRPRPSRLSAVSMAGDNHQ